MATYTPLESIVLTSAAASVTFSNISQNYQDLVLVAQCGVSTTNYLQIQLNSDTTMTNYSATWMEGDGSSASSGRYSGATGGYNLGGATTNTTLENISTIHFQNYANSTTYKSWLVRNDRASRSAHTAVGLWRNTSSINSILIKPFNSAYNLVAGSTFDLYAISPAAANTAQASGGTEIIYTNTHVIHVFKASGTFTPTRNLTADYLVVAGGGGGGSYGGSGGGGGGGLRSTVTATGGGGALESALSLTAGTAYTVTVGAGGAGGISTVEAASGSNSVFSTITSTGGGGGGGYKGSFYAAKNGGSGGGGNYYSVTTGGSASPSGQGNAGGNGANAINAAGGGGGGAGTAGGNGNPNSGGKGGDGGNGVAVSISGSSVTYAGGGGGSLYDGGGGNTGGGAGGTGGGTAGTAVNNVAASNATAHTGGGGGATRSDDAPPSVAGGSGGSGIVIVRYAR